MPNPHGSFIWYELLTTDLAAARAFYQDVIGVTIPAEPQSAPGEMDYRMISAADGLVGGAMELQPAMLEHGARPAWLGYIGVDDVDASVAAVVADGGVVQMPASDLEGIGRIALVADPQGAPFYLMRPAPTSGESDQTSRAFDREAIGHVAWNELATSDHAAALAFYPRHFGWELGDAMSMGPMGEYRFFNHGGTMIGGAMPKPAAMPVSAWSYYWHVADIDVAVERLTAGGGKVLHGGPYEVPGGSFAVNAIDPQGAVFALVGPRREC